MSGSAGRPGEPSRLREIPPAPPSYRPKWRAEGHRLLRFYKPLDDLEYEATHVAGLSLAAAMTLQSFARKTDVDGTTRVALREIARNLNRSPGQIYRHVKQLIELGFMENLGGCREDNRHRVWRIAGMDRREMVFGAPGENHHRGDATSRVRRGPAPAETFASSARIRAQLPGELAKTTRASTQQEPTQPWAGAPRGIQASREALERRRSLTGGCDGPGGDSEASRDATEPPGLLGAQNSAEGSAGSLPDGAPRSVADDASRCVVERDVLPSCSTMTDPNPDDYEPEVPDEQTEPPEPEPAPFDPNVDEPAEPPPEPATSGM